MTTGNGERREKTAYTHWPSRHALRLAGVACFYHEATWDPAYLSRFGVADTINEVIPFGEDPEPGKFGFMLLSESEVPQTHLRPSTRRHPPVNRCYFENRSKCKGRLCVRPSGDQLLFSCERHVRSEPECTVQPPAMGWIYAELTG